MYLPRNTLSFRESLKIDVFFSKVEFKFPSFQNVDAVLAFSYLVHADPGLFEILLHLTFRPYNSYCIYLDAKTDEETKKAFEGIVKCYNQHFPDTTIFLHPNPAEVYWGGYSVLNADLRCIEALLERNK